MSVRALARRHVPFEARLKAMLLRRAIHDRRARVAFATRRAGQDGFPHAIARYERTFIDYPGQEQFSTAKRCNQVLLAGELSGTVIAPGEVFSIWRLARRPTSEHGYASAAALKNRALTSEVGGSICLLSTVLYNVALLSAMEIVERHCHSVDSYGARRYFELARDASIEYGYLDLRFRNSHPYPVLLSIDVDDARVAAQLLAPIAPSFRVALLIDEPTYLPPGECLVFDPVLVPSERQLRTSGLPGLHVGGRRVVSFDDGRVVEEALMPSHHHPVPAVVACGDRMACGVP
jgi:hypothetical protein